MGMLEDMEPLFEFIEERIDHALERRRRIGWYVGTVYKGLGELARHAVTTDYDVALDKVLRISSPILDVVPGKQRLALLSRWGMPEWPAALGALWDDKWQPAMMKVWLRADLESHDGHAEFGTTKSLTIRVGSNNVTLTELPDGTLRLDADTEIQLGENAVDKVALDSLVESELADLWDAVNTHTHTIPAGTNPSGGTSGPSSSAGSAGSVGASLVKAE